MNLSLGESYNYVRKGQAEFEKTMELQERQNEGLIYAFIVYNSGQDIRPLYATQSNFIMTPTGKTFARLHK